MRTLTLLTVFFFGFTALAKPALKEWNETLTHVEANGTRTRQVALLHVDFAKQEIQVEIFTDICGQLLPIGGDVIRCMAAARLDLTLTVPLQKTTDECGSLVYSGSLDQTPVDGFRTELIVKDHSSRLCEDLVPSAVTVEGTVFNPWTNSTTHYWMMK